MGRRMIEPGAINIVIYMCQFTFNSGMMFQVSWIIVLLPWMMRGYLVEIDYKKLSMSLGCVFVVVKFALK